MCVSCLYPTRRTSNRGGDDRVSAPCVLVTRALLVRQKQAVPVDSTNSSLKVGRTGGRARARNDILFQSSTAVVSKMKRNQAV